MEETYVRLLCPACGKTWEAAPGDLPDPTATFRCPGCRAARRMAEFARTDRDLATLKQLG